MERIELEKKYGKVWNTDEVQKDYEILGFKAPFIVCVRKSDNVKGSMEFQHNPRFFFDFKRADGKSDNPLTIGDVIGLKKNATKDEINEWTIKWAKRALPKDIAEREIAKFKAELNEKKQKE